jgi:hypothetical protein
MGPTTRYQPSAPPPCLFHARRRDRAGTRLSNVAEVASIRTTLTVIKWLVPILALALLPSVAAAQQSRGGQDSVPDPTVDVRNVRKVVEVMKDGRVYRPEATGR